MLICPVPLTPVTAVVQVLFEYKAKATEPVGATEVVPANVAVSLAGLIAIPTVPVTGDATVVIVGEALATLIGSQLLVEDA